MKTKLVLLGILIVVLGAAGIFYNQLPHFATQILQKKLSEQGLQGQVEVQELNLSSHIKFKFSASQPPFLQSENIEIKWELSRVLDSIIPLQLSIESGTFQAPEHNLNGSIESIQSTMRYEAGSLHIKSISATASTSSPIKSHFHLQNTEDAKLSLFEYEFEGAAQTIDLWQLENFQKIRLLSPLRLKGTLEQVGDSWTGDIQSTHPISLSFTSLGLPGKLFGAELKSFFELSASNEVSTSNTKIKFSGSFDDLSFKSVLSSKSMRSHFSEGSLTAQVESQWTPKSLQKTFKKYDLHYLEKLTGTLSSQSTIKLHKSLASVDSYINGKFSKGLLTAVPFKDVDFKLAMICQQKPAWACTPKDSAHHIHINRAGDEFPIKNIRLDLTTKSSAIAGNFSTNWLGAKIADEEFTGRLKDHQLEFKSDLSINDIELSQLSKIIDLSQLQATGKMRGILKMEYSSKDGLKILPSQLASIESGTLHYKDPSSADIPKTIETLKQFNDLMKKGQQALVYKALDNFQYKSFVIEAQRPEPKKLSIKLHLDGSNPDLARGQVFDISIPIEGNLEGLLAESSFQKLAESESSEEYVKKLRKALAK